MAWLAVRINEVIGTPLDEEGEELEDGWELDDKEEVLIWISTGDWMDIENGMMDIRDVIWEWENKQHGPRSDDSVQGTPSGG